MMWSLKPFNGAEMRNYLDMIKEESSPQPTAQQAADLDAGTQQVAQGADKFSQGNYASGAMDVAKGMNATANAAGLGIGDKLNAVGMAIKAAGSAGLASLRGRNPAYAAMGSLAKNVTGPAADYVSSPQFAQQFKAGIDAARNNPNADPSLKQMVADYDAGKLTADSFKAYVQRVASKANAAASGQEVDFDGNDDYTVKEQGQAAPLDIDLDILNEQQSAQVKVPPIPALPPTDGELPGGEQVYTNPDGTRSYAGGFGKFTYDKSGKAITYTTPNLGGFGQEVDLQTGLVNTGVQVGDIKMSAKQRPDQSTVTSVSAPIGANTVSMDQGIGFGGAGKDVEQGGNKIYSVTGPDPDDKRQEPDKQSFAGRKPTQQELGDLMKEDEELPGTKGEWRHGGHSVRYHPDKKTVHVKGQGGEDRHEFSKHPSHENYRKKVQQIIDKLENSLTEAEKIRNLMNRLS